MTHGQAARDREDNHPIASSTAQEKPLLKLNSKNAEVEPATPLHVTGSQQTRSGDDEHSVASSIAQKKPPSSQKKNRVANWNAEASQATAQTEDDESKGTIAGIAASTPMRVTRNRATKIAEEGAQSRVLRSQKKTRGADQK
jgi:hypothetical protein